MKGHFGRKDQNVTHNRFCRMPKSEAKLVVYRDWPHRIEILLILLLNQFIVFFHKLRLECINHLEDKQNNDKKRGKLFLIFSLFLDIFFIST